MIEKMLQRLYYAAKPYLPWSVRMAFRRQRASRRRLTYGDVWPISRRAAVSPPGWPGWPCGKRFAVVLTHDVEGSKGFGRLDALMQLEQNHGVRSSFNFVPEGEYSVTKQLCERLESDGFEVGVHGLRHDGKLYSSKTRFASDAAKIREFARQWNAVGFRSPLMQHKLGWIHELGLEYDSSTFDTDPFEPQPDSVETIFPFWVPSPWGGGYVELPYTLPQDFSLFVMLQEQTIEIWKRKLDWVAEHGGMVLLNTHPDYMCFGGSPQRDEFPATYYAELLNYITERYGGTFWLALPREVSRYYCATIPEVHRNTRKKVCMVVYSNYESDNRVRRYSEALASRGDLVDVIAVATGDSPMDRDEISGVTVHRIQHRERNEKRRWHYVSRLIGFLAKSSVFLARHHALKRYDMIHVHNVPDFLVFAAWYPKWTGAKIILDIHDIVPELYTSKFNTRGDHLCSELLKWVEKLSANFADHVIVSNHLWFKKLIARSVPESKCSTFINHVDTSLFWQHQRTRNDTRFVMIFPGSFQWHQGLDVAIGAVALIKERVPNIEFQIYGDGPETSRLSELCEQLDLRDSVRFCGTLPLDQIADVIANADLGVVPKRADSFGNEAFSTKIMEFMSQGVPVVASRTKIDSFYYTDEVVRFFASGDSQSLADAMLDVFEHRELRESLVNAGYKYVALNCWETRKKEYLTLVDSLTVEPISGTFLS